METTSSEKLNKFPKQFKSYYVVWKPCLYAFLPFYFFEFKSYYVVWKLIAGAAKYFEARGV